jgi:hypothetical protein
MGPSAVSVLLSVGAVDIGLLLGRKALLAVRVGSEVSAGPS